MTTLRPLIRTVSVNRTIVTNVNDEADKNDIESNNELFTATKLNYVKKLKKLFLDCSGRVCASFLSCGLVASSWLAS